MSSSQQNKLTVVVKRFLDLTWILFLFLAVVWPLVILVVGISISSDPEKRHTDVSAFLSLRVSSELSAESAAGSDPTNDLILSGQGDMNINNTRSRMSWYLSGAISEILLVFFLYGLLKMRRLFASLAEGSTFTGENVERIRRIGYLIVAWHIISPALQYFGGQIMLKDIALNMPGIELFPAFEFNIGGVFVGLAIIVLSGVLREAVNIYQDQSLTI